MIEVILRGTPTIYVCIISLLHSLLNQSNRVSIFNYQFNQSATQSLIDIFELLIKFLPNKNSFKTKKESRRMYNTIWLFSIKFNQINKLFFQASLKELEAMQWGSLHYKVALLI